MNYRFKIIKRTFEKDSLVIFIDLLGTTKLYGSTLQTEQQAEKALSALLEQFDINFSKYFEEKELKDSFDISIFADSIVISQRKNIPNIVERLVDFSLGYQISLLSMAVPTRTIIAIDSFFSFKLIDPSKKSILGSQCTSVSLCGGRGVISAHKRQKGLPIGVYVDNILKTKLNAEQKKGIIPIMADDNLSFIKQKHNILNILPDDTLSLLVNNSNASIKAIRHSLEASQQDKEAIEKFLPWILIHLGRKKYV